MENFFNQVINSTLLVAVTAGFSSLIIIVLWAIVGLIVMALELMGRFWR